MIITESMFLVGCVDSINLRCRVHLLFQPGILPEAGKIAFFHNKYEMAVLGNHEYSIQ